MRRRDRGERSDKWSRRIEIPEDSHSNGVLPREVRVPDILAQIDRLDRKGLHAVRDYIDSLLGPRDSNLWEVNHK